MIAGLSHLFKDPSLISVERFLELLGYPRLTVLGAVNQVNHVLDQRLGHNEPPILLFRPFRALPLYPRQPGAPVAKATSAPG